jgi:microsomal dipeptidase-like Zn-dependent dipeptidase
MQLARVIPFIPTGNGMQDDGRKVIQGLFSRGICVDVKHMSYKSRLDLMTEIDAGNFQNVQPLYVHMRVLQVCLLHTGPDI